MKIRKFLNVCLCCLLSCLLLVQPFSVLALEPTPTPSAEPSVDDFLNYFIDSFKYDIQNQIDIMADMGGESDYVYNPPDWRDYPMLRDMIKSYMWLTHSTDINKSYEDYLKNFREFQYDARKYLRVGIDGLVNGVKEFFDSFAVPDLLYPNDVFSVNGINYSFKYNSTSSSYEYWYDILRNGVKVSHCSNRYIRAYGGAGGLNRYESYAYRGIMCKVYTFIGEWNEFTFYLYPIQGKNVPDEWKSLMDSSGEYLPLVPDDWYIAVQNMYEFSLTFKRSDTKETLFSGNTFYTLALFLDGYNTPKYAKLEDDIKSFSIPKNIVQNNFNITNNYIYVNKGLEFEDNMTPEDFIDIRNNGKGGEPMPTPSATPEPSSKPTSVPTARPTPDPKKCGFDVDTVCTVDENGLQTCYSNGKFVGKCLIGTDDPKESAQGIWGVLEELAKIVGGIIKTALEGLGGAINGIAGFLKGVWDLLSNVAWSSLLELIKSVIKFFADVAKQLVSLFDVFDKVETRLLSLYEFLPWPLSLFATYLTQLSFIVFMVTIIKAIIRFLL